MRRQRRLVLCRLRPFCVVVFCVLCFFSFPVQRILIYTYQLQIHLYNLKKLLVPVNPPTMPCIFSRVSVPPWRRRFVTAPPPPPSALPPATLQCGCEVAAVVVEWGGSLKCLQRFTRTTPISRVKTPSPRPGFELARGQKSVFHHNLQVRGRDGKPGKCCRCVFFFFYPSSDGKESSVGS